MMTLEETHDKYVKMRQHVALLEIQKALDDWREDRVVAMRAWVAFGLGEREEMPEAREHTCPEDQRKGRQT